MISVQFLVPIIISIMLCIPKIVDYLEFLTDEEVKDL